jgi:uncharacterized protein
VASTLIVPGLHGSGPDHWQTWFERQIDGAVRVQQEDWAIPDLARWSARLRRMIDAAHGDVWIVAHSFGCLALADIAPDCRERIAGALLVAPADPEKFALTGSRVDEALGFPAILVASSNDPWLRTLRAAWLAERWGCHLIHLGAAGHINESSGFGPWPAGLAMFKRLQQVLGDGPHGQLDEAGAPRPGSPARRAASAPNFDWARYLGSI